MFLGNPYLWLEARKTRPIRKRWIGRDTSTLAPRSAFALLSDPGGRTCQAVTTRPRGPRSDHDEGSRIATFEAQSHSFGTGCLRFAGWITPPPRKTRFRLPARLYRTGFPPAGFLQKVSNSHHVCYPPLPNFMAQGQAYILHFWRSSTRSSDPREQPIDLRGDLVLPLPYFAPDVAHDRRGDAPVRAPVRKPGSILVPLKLVVK